MAISGASSVYAASASQYPTPGTEAQKFRVIATQDGPLNLYFIGGNSVDNVSIRVGNAGLWNSDPLFDSKSSKYGEKKVTTAPVIKGTVIELWINKTLAKPHRDFYGRLITSPDPYPTDVQRNLAYTTSFAGDAAAGIPAGIYVGIEDDRLGGDFDYNDLES